MASEPILASFDLAGAKRSRFWDARVWFDYFALTKPEVLIERSCSAGH